MKVDVVLLQLGNSVLTGVLIILESLTRRNYFSLALLSWAHA